MTIDRRRRRSMARALLGVSLLGLGVGTFLQFQSDELEVGTGPQESSSEPSPQYGDKKILEELLSIMNLDPVIDASEQRLARQCMAHKGFDLHSSPVYPRPLVNLTGLAPMSLEEARVYGFSLRLAASTGAAPQNVPALEEAALLGPPDSPTVSGPFGFSTPAEGCLSVARTAVYGSLQTFLDIVSFQQEFRMNVGGWWHARSSKRASIRALDCINAFGHAFADFDEILVLAKRQHAGGNAATSAETKLAMERARCERSSGMWVVQEQEALRMAWPWIESELSRIGRLATVVRVTTQKARRTMGTGWQPADPLSPRIPGSR